MTREGRMKVKQDEQEKALLDLGFSLQVKSSSSAVVTKKPTSVSAFICASFFSTWKVNENDIDYVPSLQRS